MSSANRAYLKVRWVHDLPDEAVLWYHELDSNRFEVRKVVVFVNGKSERAGEGESTDYAELGPEPMPLPAEIAAQDDFHVLDMSGDEFEQRWLEAAPSASV